MVDEDQEARIRELGLRVGRANVANAVAKLEDGRSLYALWADKDDPLTVSRNTARKIQGLWQSGEMAFLVDAELGVDAPPDPQYLSRYAETYASLSDILEMDWTIRELERRGVPAEEAPKLLRWYERHRDRRQSVPPMRVDPTRLAICFEVKLYQDYPGLRPAYAKPLLRVFVRDVRLSGGPGRVLNDLLKYQPWRSPDHLKTLRAEWRRRSPSDEKPPSFVQRLLRALV